MKKYLLIAIAAVVAVVSCAKPEVPEGDSACTLGALKVWVYDAEGTVVAKDLDALSGMFDKESGAAMYRFPSGITDVSRCRLEASIPATASIVETDAAGVSLGHGLGGMRSLDNVTVYFRVKAADGKNFKNYQVYFRL